MLAEDKNQSQLIVPAANLQSGVIYTIQVNVSVKVSEASSLQSNQTVIVTVRSPQLVRSLEDLAITPDLYSVAPAEGLSGVQTFKASYFFCKVQAIKDLKK